MVYTWRDGFVSRGVKAEDAHAVVESVRAVQPTLTADAIVGAAEAVDSPIHRLFEWDDGEAAKEYRRSQARDLLGAIVTVEIEGDEPTREYVHVRSVEGYVPTRDALNTPGQREETLERALAELESYVSRYKSFSRVAGLIEDVKVVVKRHRATKAA